MAELDAERTPGGAVLMDGNRLRDELVAELRHRITDLGNPHVCLATVLVGDDKPSQIYIRNKRKKAEEAGMVSRHVELVPRRPRPRSRRSSEISPAIPTSTAFSCSCHFPTDSTPNRSSI